MTGKAGSFWVAKPKVLKAAKQKPGEPGFRFSGRCNLLLN
jgi:hypothetical protein